MSREDEYIRGLPKNVQQKLAMITDEEQRRILIGCLVRGEEIPTFAWKPIENIEEKLGLVEKVLSELQQIKADSKWRPESYWNKNGKPIRGAHTSVREPAYDVGEYLPKSSGSEVEIARISLKSTTGDVISIRARRSGNRILYSVADEYETEFTLNQKSSKLPLSTEEIIVFVENLEVDGEKHLNGILEMNLEEDREEARGFMTVCSSFYPGLEEHFDAWVEEWIRQENEK